MSGSEHVLRAHTYRRRKARSALARIALGFGVVASCRENAQLPDASPDIYRALVEQDLIPKISPRVVHLSHVCDVEVDETVCHVIDLRQLTTDGPSPRGFNEIVTLDDGLRVLKRIEYVNARPLYCSGSDVVTYGDVAVESSSSVEGNVLRFSDGCRRVEIAGQLEAARMSGMRSPDLR